MDGLFPRRVMRCFQVPDYRATSSITFSCLVAEPRGCFLPNYSREVLVLYRKRTGAMILENGADSHAGSHLIQRLEGSRPDLAGQLLMGTESKK
jgi:hypothetical protein